MTDDAAPCWPCSAACGVLKHLTFPEFRFCSSLKHCHGMALSLCFCFSHRNRQFKGSKYIHKLCTFITIIQQQNFPLFCRWKAQVSIKLFLFPQPQATSLLLSVYICYWLAAHCLTVHSMHLLSLVSSELLPWRCVGFWVFLEWNEMFTCCYFPHFVYGRLHWWISYGEPPLHLWVETYLTVVDDIFEVFFDLVCILLSNFASMFIMEIVLKYFLSYRVL